AGPLEWRRKEGTPPQAGPNQEQWFAHFAVTKWVARQGETWGRNSFNISWEVLASKLQQKPNSV
ncbi:hypothetical protein, partial [uncultured Pseudomonas sp.]|uniref:hypothetical protein n=1 Tax=uncultured Pseudomonas sp. TaxID=114707 RepID=UPI0025F5E6EF